MLIGIEAERANTQRLTGVEHYAKQLIISLSKIDRQNKYVLYLRSAPSDWILRLPQNFNFKVMPFPIFWTQLRISWEMLWRPCDVLFIMASALPFIHPRNSVVTIHDLAWDFYPETFKPFQRFYLRVSTWHACKFARSIIAVSERTRKDIIAKYRLPSSKVNTIHLGFDPSTEVAMEDNLEERDKIAKLPEKFILCLGTLQPRKNIIGLIDTFADLKREKKIEHSLVIAGGKGWLYEQILEKAKSFPDIIYFGYANDRFELLKRAAILVQPAFYEGFGLTILDAFAAAVPVACSATSCLPEVAGNAALYFDPKNIGEMKQSIYSLLSNLELRRDLIAKGAQRLKIFTWEKCGQKTLEVLTQPELPPVKTGLEPAA